MENPSSSKLDDLCRWLADRSPGLNSVEDAPNEQLQRCAEAGVFRWFVPNQFGGFGYSPTQIAEGYIKLGASCLTTTFVITQWVAAVSRIVRSGNDELKHALIPDLLNGKTHTTVGISHLTTSRRHLAEPVLKATSVDDGFCLTGFSPWVTAAPFADFFLIGANLDNGQQVLMVVESDLPGISIDSSQSLVALSSSRTGSVRFDEVLVPARNLVAGPAEAVLASKKSSGTGGLQTSTLALALSRSAIDYIDEQASRRVELSDKAARLQQQWQSTFDDLIDAANDRPACSNEELRTRANSLALRSTQAAMVAAKGAGFVEGHPVGRWCREALFFLVWSCPPSVLEANLCELAGIQS